MAADPSDLESVYRAYVDALNGRRFDDLGRFVQDRLAYNGDPRSLAQYRALLEEDVRVVPDLRYEIDDLVVAGDRVAARLGFDCHPSGVLLGVPVDGRRLVFAEHVFYRFDAGRIVDVRSLIDVETIRRQSASFTE